jgi:fructuronate reductase
VGNKRGDSWRSMPDVSTSPRLSRKTHPSPRGPADRRIVHLGIGAFARAHLALYAEDAEAAGGEAWDILGVSLQRPDQRDRLAPQDYLYTAIERGPRGNTARIVNCLSGVLVAPENPSNVLDALAAPATAIVTLTVTEKGYCHDPASGRLNLSHPDIVHDLAKPDAPRTAVGFIVEALRRRRLAGVRPFTVLSCDNLPANGRLLAGLVANFAEVGAPDLSAWIAADGAFPCSMVDRIVPAAVPEDAVEAAMLTGFADAAPVSHEPFRQWVIEDHFIDGLRPRWERVGAMLTENVEPFELMKLRLLNGAHSALAYVGYLAGRQTIAEAMADPVLAAFVDRLWAEVLLTVPPPPETDLVDYTRDLAERFRNPAIQHRTWQIAMDGSQKLPQRLLGSVRDRLARGLPIPCLALTIAAWCRYVGGIDETGAAIDVRDPLAAGLRARIEGAGSEGAVRALLSEKAIFGTDLERHDGFIRAIEGAYARLARDGARVTVERYLLHK